MLCISILSVWTVLQPLLDAVAPRRCAGCSLPAAGAVCEACVELCALLPRPRARAAPFGAIHAALPYDPPASALVHHAKYRGNRGAADVLGALLVGRVWATLATAVGTPDSASTLIVPVPLGRRRRRARGYNQAELLAAALARAAGLPLSDHAVRLRDTAPQVGRDAASRRAALDAAFAWRGRPLHGCTVWLVDDVVTTGATMCAVATALQQAGAHRIDGVAAAMAGAH
jgi:ComF family protein